jgi:hypothetical protein
MSGSKRSLGGRIELALVYAAAPLALWAVAAILALRILE